MDKVAVWLGHRSVSTTEKYYRNLGLLKAAYEGCLYFEGEAA